MRSKRSAKQFVVLLLVQVARPKGRLQLLLALR